VTYNTTADIPSILAQMLCVFYLTNIVNNTDCAVFNDWMIVKNELEKGRRKVLSQYVSGRPEGNQERPQL
jgi:hypothetical protein